jgi:hypothetical protein
MKPARLNHICVTTPSIAVLSEMNATLDRIGETMASMNVTIGEIRESMSSLDKRVSHTEGDVVAAFHVKPLPFRGGVGVGAVRKYRRLAWLTVPTPGPSPKGEGRL